MTSWIKIGEKAIHMMVFACLFSNEVICSKGEVFPSAPLRTFSVDQRRTILSLPPEAKRDPSLENSME